MTPPLPVPAIPFDDLADALAANPKLLIEVLARLASGDISLVYRIAEEHDGSVRHRRLTTWLHELWTRMLSEGAMMGVHT